MISGPLIFIFAVSTSEITASISANNIGGYPIYILAFFIGLVFLTIPGLVWSPFAALISALIARSRGLNVGRYALSGATHSAGFLLPWIYLVLRMYSVSVPRVIAILIYIFIYSVWLIGPLLISVVASLTAYNEVFLPKVFPPSHREIVVGYVVLFITPVMTVVYFYMWISSLAKLIRTHISGEQSSSDSITHLLIGDRYTRPFIFALISVWMWVAFSSIILWMQTGRLAVL